MTMTDKSTIRVMIVDDHEMVREGLGMFLESCDDLELVASLDSGEEAMARCLEINPDVVLMDLIMPGCGGIEAIRSINKILPDAKNIALTSFDDEALIREALRAGASGYILKNVSIDALAASIRAAQIGDPALGPEATSILMARENADAPHVEDLTDRESEVLKLMVEGLSNPQIAARLFIGSSTVKSHVSNILSKLNVSTRAEAAAFAIRSRLIR